MCVVCITLNHQLNTDIKNTCVLALQLSRLTEWIIDDGAVSSSVLLLQGVQQLLQHQPKRRNKPHFTLHFNVANIF